MEKLLKENKQLAIGITLLLIPYIAVWIIFPQLAFVITMGACIYFGLSVIASWSNDR